jgi:hypothetical protein
MKIYKDKKPDNCIMCPLVRLQICGKEHKVQATSGAAYIEVVPDCRCRIINTGDRNLTIRKNT